MKSKCYVIPTQKQCNVDCIFCSTKLYNYSTSSEFMELDDHFYYSLTQLEQKQIKTVEITGGGEPFLNKNLNKIIDSIRSKLPSVYIRLYTNGRIHQKIHYIDELCISAVHWDQKVVQQMCPSHNQLTLFEHLDYFRDSGDYIIRLSVPMIRGGIDSLDSATELIEKTNEYVDKYVFRPLHEGTVSRSKIYADFNLILPNVEIDREFCCNDTILLWFADNQFYTTWDLSK